MGLIQVRQPLHPTGDGEALRRCYTSATISASGWMVSSTALPAVDDRRTIPSPARMLTFAIRSSTTVGLGIEEDRSLLFPAHLSKSLLPASPSWSPHDIFLFISIKNYEHGHVITSYPHYHHHHTLRNIMAV